MIILNGEIVKPTIFPDGTSQVWHLDNIKTSDNVVEWYFERESEFIHILQLLELLFETRNITLKMPYLPYGRQDKGVFNDCSFALKTFAKVLSGKVDLVECFDTHNASATYEYLNAYKIVEFTSESPIPKLDLHQYDVIIFPDEGARNRYLSEIAYYAGFYKLESVFGEKVRRQSDGFITHYEIIGDVDLTDKRCLVIDDICDGGATFNILADSLHEQELKRLDLFVSHGLFSKGISTLLSHYDKIITTDTCYKAMFFGKNEQEKEVVLRQAAKQSTKWLDIWHAYRDDRLEIINV